MHQTSGRWKYGLFLSLVTAFVWGTLPLILKGVLDVMDPVTITWYRYIVAAVLIGLFLSSRKRLPDLSLLKGVTIILTLVCIVSLVFNYNSYVFGLETITPSSAQVMIQFAPMLLLLGGIFIYGEKFSIVQWLGFFTFLIGIILFFNQRLEEIFASFVGNAQQDARDYSIGLLWIFIASITWAIYALSQKQLLKVFGSAGINLFIYVGGTLLILPFAHPLTVTDLNSTALFLLFLSCLNTVVGYGAFAEALNHWEASRVSAIIAMQPLFTIGLSRILYYFFPGYLPLEEINSLSFLGAVLVMGGSMVAALYRKK